MGNKEEDDERKRGGRHIHGDEKGDTQRDTDAQRKREKRKCLFFTSGYYRGRGNVICLCIRPKRRRILAQADSYGCLSDCSIEGILANVSIALFLFSLFAVLPLSHNMCYFFLYLFF